MNRAVLDATVEDYDHEMAAVGALPDSGDVHVVAAAIKAEAEIILTPRARLAQGAGAKGARRGHHQEEALGTGQPVRPSV